MFYAIGELRSSTAEGSSVDRAEKLERDAQMQQDLRAGKCGAARDRPADAADRGPDRPAPPDHSAGRWPTIEGMSMLDTTVAIIGAGIGGIYLAAELGRRGCRLRLHDIDDGRLLPIRERGGLDIEGDNAGFAAIERVTTDPEAAIEGAEIIAVCTGGTYQEAVGRGLASLLRDGQTILLIQGNTGGSLVVRRALDAAGCCARVDIAEMDNYPYSCWRLGPARIRPIVHKKFLQIASFPGSCIDAVFTRLGPLFPSAIAAPASFRPASPTPTRCCMSPIALPMPVRSTAAKHTNSTPKA